VNNALKEFKEFVSRGNLVELAVAFVLGVTFAALITSFIKNVIMPIVAIPFGKPNFDDTLVLTIHHARIQFGAFLTDLVVFIAVAIVLFLIVKAYNALTRRNTDAAPTEVDLLTQIRDELRAGRGGAA
jgi:large conductance mechanosensitive channel